MTYQLEILPAAEHENAETITWLVEHASHDRSVAYIAAISKALDEILALPLAWPAWGSVADVRVRHVRSISCSIFYRVQRSTIVVIAFAHPRRQPGYWVSRVK